MGKEVKPMNETERALAENLAKAVTLLPDHKREFLLGYAEGVAAMAARDKPKRKKKTVKPAS